MTVTETFTSSRMPTPPEEEKAVWYDDTRRRIICTRAAAAILKEYEGAGSGANKSVEELFYQIEPDMVESGQTSYEDDGNVAMTYFAASALAQKLRRESCYDFGGGAPKYGKQLLVAAQALASHFLMSRSQRWWGILEAFQAHEIPDEQFTSIEPTPYCDIKDFEEAYEQFCLEIA